MSFALACMSWKRQGSPAVLRVLEALGSQDQQPLAVLMLFQGVTAPQILPVVQPSSSLFAPALAQKHARIVCPPPALL